MSEKVENQKPFDVLMNEELLLKCNRKTPLGKIINENTKWSNGNFVVQNWFISIVKNQEMMDKVTQFPRNGKHQKLEDGFEKVVGSTKLLITLDEDGDDIESVFVLINKGGKLYKVVSHKDYGKVKSRMERNDKGKLVPYGKSNLVPFEGKYEEYILKSEGKWSSSIQYLSKDYQYVDGKPNGECFDYFKKERGYSDFGSKDFPKRDYPNNFELTNYKMGKKDGLYLNTTSGLKGNYLNGKKNGEWFEQPDRYIGGIGKVVETINYVNGVKNGEWSSNVGEKGYYQNDLMDGEYTLEYRDRMITGNYQLGKKIGVWSSIDESDRNGYDGYVLTDLIFKDDGSVVRIKYTHETLPQEYVDVIKSEVFKRVDFIRDTSNPLINYGGDENEKLMIPIEISWVESGLKEKSFDFNSQNGWIGRISVENDNLWSDWVCFVDETIRVYNYPHYEKLDNWYNRKKLLLPVGKDGYGMDDYSVSIPSINRSNEGYSETLIDGVWVKSKVKISEYQYEPNKIYEEYTKKIVQKHLDGLSELYVSQQKEKEEELKKENPVYKVELSSFPMD